MSNAHHLDWNPRDPSILDAPLTAYDRMRHECPLAWSDHRHSRLPVIWPNDLGQLDTGKSGDRQSLFCCVGRKVSTSFR